MFFKAKKQTIKNANFFKEIAAASSADLIIKLESSVYGLNEEKIESKEKEFGKNTFARGGFLWYKKLLQTIANPFVAILFVIIIYNLISYFVINKNSPSDRIGDLWGAIIVAIMVVLSVSISYFQDFRSHKSAEKLRQLVETTASVFRQKPDTKQAINLKDLNSVSQFTTEVLIEELVPGDIIFLSSGDMVPADVRILASTDLFINQSSLTGESIPVEKHASANIEIQKNNTNILELQNLCFLGTSVVSGGAIAIVIATGSTSYFGTIASSITAKRPATSFDKGLKKISFVLLGFMLVMVPAIFVINALTKHDILAALIFSISVAVGITPEMLPMIVSANLARGALKLSKKKVIVKNLSSVQNFGAMDVLCTDKTGTLTEDKIELVKHLNANGQESKEVLKFGYLNSIFQTGLKNNIDKTIIEHIKSHSEINLASQKYYKVDEIPFDFARRKMSVVVNQNQEKNILICKGAVEEVLKICQEVEVNGKIATLDQEITKKILKLSAGLNSQGLRVIAIAYRNFSTEKSVYKVTDESNLTLLGYIGFLDVPKQSAITAIRNLKLHGVEIKILTGDNEVVTKAICQKVGLEPKTPLLGTDIETMNDTELREKAKKTNIFAKMDPLQKARIIDVLKLKDHTVGFLGDGINDAVALQHADVGITVNTAADIAKEASDIILLEKDLDVLEQGVIGGRNTFGNILKYIKITISSNLGNSLSILIASIWLNFFPMVAIQILLQNLLYDISQLSIPWDKVDQEFLEKPQRWNTKSIIPFALWNGPLSSVFDIITFVFLGYGLNVFTNGNHGLFQAGWFILGITTQTLIFHLLRTQKIPFLQRISSIPVLITTVIIAIIGVCIPFTALGTALGFMSLPAIYFGYLFGVLFAYFILSQLWKMLYIKINKSWL